MPQIASDNLVEVNNKRQLNLVITDSGTVMMTVIYNITQTPELCEVEMH